LKDEPADELEDGLVAARFVDYVDGNQWIVEVPDGEVIAVDGENVTDRPTPIVPPRPTSMKPPVQAKPYVPL